MGPRHLKVFYNYQEMSMGGTDWESNGHFWCTYILSNQIFKVKFNVLSNVTGLARKILVSLRLVK